MMAKTEIGIHHRRGIGGFDNVGLRMRIHFSAAQVFEVEVQVTEADVADTFRFGVGDFFCHDRCLFVTGTCAL